MKISGENHHILIVDDNPRNLQILGKALLKENYNLEYAINGEAALNWIQEKVFDLVILDIMMPGITGLDVCTELRKNEKYNDVPVIFLSADNNKETILQGFERGGQDYITKPFDSRELIARVSTQLELKESREVLMGVNQHLEKKVAERTEELRCTNEELRHANEELLALDRIKLDFMNIISHEIRTPLNGILGSVLLLKENSNRANLDFLLKLLYSSASRLEKFSFASLIITELRTGQSRPNMENILVKEILEKSIELQGEGFTTKNIKTRILPDDPAISITCDKRLISAGISSILCNTERYSPEEGNVEIRVTQDQDFTYVTFLDEGPGFSDEAIKHQFKLFRPGEPHIDQNSGIELSMVKMIMDIHGGNIQISNRAEGGAKVQLSFKKDI